MILRAVFLVTQLLTAGLQPGQDLAAGGWKYLKTTEGVDIYARSVKGYDIDEVMGRGYINAPYETTVKALLDIKSYPKYFKDITELSVLEARDSNTFIVYSVIDAPWPMQDRDSVVIKKITREKNSTTMHSSALSDYRGKIPYRKDTVRITEYEETWMLRPDGGRTFAVYTGRADPEGVFPKALVSYMMDVSALKTIRNFRKMVKDYNR